MIRGSLQDGGSNSRKGVGVGIGYVMSSIVAQPAINTRK